MKTAKTLCVTLPPELLAKAKKTAAREHRTMSELVREALRQYMGEGAQGKQPSDRAVAEATRPQAGCESDVIHSFRMEK